MRIGVFGDIHGNWHALEAVLADMGQRGVDRLVCLGDVVMKGPLPKECVDRVRALGCPVVLGNTDGCFHPDQHPSRYPVRTQTQRFTLLDYDRNVAALSADDQQWLCGLPLTHTAVVEGQRLDYFHAVPDNNYVLVLPDASHDELQRLRLSPDTRIACFGHSHRAFMRQVGDLLVINPGSAGLSYDGDPRACYAIIDLLGDVTSAQLVRVPYAYEAAVAAAKQVGMQGWELFAHTVRTGLFPG